nr:hypothetical protein Iba_contig1589CG0010 [Ipomoea batatas]
MRRENDGRTGKEEEAATMEGEEEEEAGEGWTGGRRRHCLRDATSRRRHGLLEMLECYSGDEVACCTAGLLREVWCRGQRREVWITLEQRAMKTEED